MPEYPLPILGPNVLIRKLIEEDLEAFYSLESDDEVKRHLGGPVQKPRAEWISQMSEVLQCPGELVPLAIVIKATRKYAGRARVYQQISIGAFAWEIEVLISKEYWGHHIGREAAVLLTEVAFGALNAESVIATIAPSNIPSGKVFERDLGFVQIATKEADGYWDNGHIIFQCNRGDWKRQFVEVHR